MNKFLFLLFLCFHISSFCQKIDIEAHKKNIIVLGYINKDGPFFVGTGFLVEIDSIFHIVTAKHVITFQGPHGELTNQFNDQNLYAFFHTTDGKIKVKSLSEIKNRYQVNWLIHSDSLVDIAILPFDIDLKSDDLRSIPQTSFLGTNSLFETYDIYFVSYHPGLDTGNDFNPIFRSGNISRINKDKTILLDAFAFPGNSGSPVFLKSSSFRFDSDNINIGGDPIGDKFIGIIGAYVPYEDIAVSIQTNKPRVIFQENSGIAIIWSIDFINEIINSPMSKKQLKFIKNNIK
jgi:V8-like Glu-specific endopeptidase